MTRPTYTVLHIDASTGIVLNRLPPHLRRRKIRSCSHVAFDDEASALAYAETTSKRYSHVGCLVLDADKTTLHEIGNANADWFGHPVPLDYSRRLNRLDSRRKWRFASNMCSLISHWFESGVLKTADNQPMHRSRGCGRLQMEHQPARPGDR
ncbi:hypothetical protein CA51_27010 [Rosistilla oblonga]|nr:hypothetical protein CA51_27010 [Rosistilla oblonga]